MKIVLLALNVQILIWMPQIVKIQLAQQINIHLIITVKTAIPIVRAALVPIPITAYLVPQEKF